MLTGIYVILFSALSFASTQVVGNGGDGFRDNGKIYSFDLFEHHMHRNAALSSEEPNPLHLARIRKSIPILSPELAWLLGAKLQQAYLISPSFALSILKAIEFYRWEFSSSRLPDIDDENLGKNQQYKNKLVQLAVRSHYTITIDEVYFSSMDDVNKIALLFHEAAHAIIKPQTDDSGNFDYQDAKQVRAIIAELFSPVVSRSSFLSKIAGHYPDDVRPVILESKTHILYGTRLGIRHDGFDVGNFTLPENEELLSTKLFSTVAGADLREIQLVGLADFAFFEPKIYKAKTGYSHWYLGFGTSQNVDFGPRLGINSKKDHLPLTPDSDFGVTFENMCGDGISISFSKPSNGRFSYAYPCLQDWLQNPGRYF